MSLQFDGFFSHAKQNSKSMIKNFKHKRQRKIVKFNLEEKPFRKTGNSEEKFVFFILKFERNEFPSTCDY